LAEKTLDAFPATVRRRRLEAASSKVTDSELDR
jgi:hypothetical protein